MTPIHDVPYVCETGCKACNVHLHKRVPLLTSVCSTCFQSSICVRSVFHNKYLLYISMNNVYNYCYIGNWEVHPPNNQLFDSYCGNSGS